MSNMRKVEIEVVLALAERQVLLSVALPQGATVMDAIDQSGIAAEFPDLDLASLTVGVWGRVVQRSRPVREGERIEIYRPLPIDPRRARRHIAVEGGFMGGSGPESE
jgi:putative ubiquitin-RnfH superfamily antitoxin RatB of RatAB toxin-antitoxin module